MRSNAGLGVIHAGEVAEVTGIHSCSGTFLGRPLFLLPG